MKIFVSATVLVAALGLATAANAAAPRLGAVTDAFALTTSMPGVQEVGYRGGWKHGGHKAKKRWHRTWKPRVKKHRHHGYCRPPIVKVPVDRMPMER